MEIKKIADHIAGAIANKKFTIFLLGPLLAFLVLLDGCNNLPEQTATSQRTNIPQSTTDPKTSTTFNNAINNNSANIITPFDSTRSDFYKIQNVSSGKYLSITGSDSTKVYQQDCTDSDDQSFYFIFMPGDNYDFFSILNKSNEHLLDIRSSNNNKELQQYNGNAPQNPYFSILMTSNEYATLMSHATSGGCLESTSTAAGTEIQNATCTHDVNQKWFIIPSGFSCQITLSSPTPFPTISTIKIMPLGDSITYGWDSGGNAAGIPNDLWQTCIDNPNASGCPNTCYNSYGLPDPGCQTVAAPTATGTNSCASASPPAGCSSCSGWNDSNTTTQSVSNCPGYRRHLASLLNNNNTSFKFLGSNNIYNGNDGVRTDEYGNSYNDHSEGHPCWTISGLEFGMPACLYTYSNTLGGSITGGNIGRWIDPSDDSKNPNIILLMIGTNDSSDMSLAVPGMAGTSSKYGNDYASSEAALGRLKHLLQTINTKTSNAYMLLSTVPYNCLRSGTYGISGITQAGITDRPDFCQTGGSNTSWSRLAGYNTAIKNFVNTFSNDALYSEFSTRGNKLKLVDMNTDKYILSPSYISADTVHPNAAGYKRIGQAWYDAIETILNAQTNSKQSGASTQPISTPIPTPVSTPTAAPTPTPTSTPLPTSTPAPTAIPTQPNNNSFQLTSASSNDVLWPASGAIDGNTSTCYSSNNFSSVTNDRTAYLAAWMSSAQTVSQVILTARMNNGVTNGFPIAYDIYLTASDNSAWNKVGSFTTSTDSTGVANIALPKSYTTWGIMIIPTILGKDDGGGYYFQMAEIQLSGATPASTPAPTQPSTKSLQLTSASSNDVLWPASSAIDGNTGTCYSSNNFSSATNDRTAYLAAWMSSAQTISQVILTARMNNGVANGFPIAYDIYLTASDNSAWNKVGSFTTPPDSTGVANIALPKSYTTWGIMIIPTVLGKDDGGGYYFQMAEIGLQ